MTKDWYFNKCPNSQRGWQQQDLIVTTKNEKLTSAKAIKSYEIEGCCKCALSNLNLAPYFI